jgi:hypothetical protein
MKIKIVFPIAYLLSLGVMAQTNPNLGNEEVEISGEYEPIVNDANRLLNNPVPIQREFQRLEMNYAPVQFDFKSTLNLEPITAATLKKEPVNKLYPFYLKAGFGTNVTPLLHFSLGNKRSKKANYLLSHDFFGTYGKLPNISNAPYVLNNLNAAGSYNLQKSVIGAHFNFKGENFNLYGIERNFTLPFIERNDLVQSVNQINAHVYFKNLSSDTNRFNYEVNGRFQNIANSFNTKENNTLFEADFNRYNGSVFIGGKITIDHHSTQTDTVRNLFYNALQEVLITGIEPYVKFKNDKLLAQVKARANIISTPGVVSKMKFFPDLYLQYHLIDRIMMPFIGVNGGLQYQGLANLYGRNRFINPFFSSGVEENVFTAFAGLKGNFTNTISYHTAIYYGRFYNKAAFIPNFLFVHPTEETVSANTAYQAFYMPQTDVLTVQCEIGYHVTEKIKLAAEVKYHRYTTVVVKDSLTLNFFPFMPEFEGRLTANYSLKEKLIFKSDIIFIGPRKFDNTGLIPALRPTFDFNLGTEYRFNNKISAFVDLNNLGFVQYAQWYNYPTQRFNLIAGLTLSF